MDDVAVERRRKGDAFPPSPSSAPFPALTPRGPGLALSSSPSGSSFFPSPPPAADAIILALPASSRACATGSRAVLTLLLAGAMDGGVEEPLLVRRSKAKKKRPAPAAPHAQEREFAGAGGGDKFLTVWREYHDLLQEMEVKKRRLQSKNQKKLRLLAEVKFLRWKYNFLMKSRSQQPNYKLKGQFQQIQSRLGINEASTFVDHDVRTGVASTSKNTNLDLNQDSVMNDERSNYHDHPKHSHFIQDKVDEDTTTKDVKFSICSSNKKNSKPSDDKRAISWQDRLALQT